MKFLTRVTSDLVRVRWWWASTNFVDVCTITSTSTSTHLAVKFFSGLTDAVLRCQHLLVFVSISFCAFCIPDFVHKSRGGFFENIFVWGYFGFWLSRANPPAGRCPACMSSTWSQKSLQIIYLKTFIKVRIRKPDVFPRCSSCFNTSHPFFTFYTNMVNALLGDIATILNLLQFNF